MLGWTQQQFWDSTYHEFVIATQALSKHQANQQKHNLVSAYYTGMFAQSNLKKYSIQKWLKALETPEEQEQHVAASKAAWNAWMKERKQDGK